MQQADWKTKEKYISIFCFPFGGAESDNAFMAVKLELRD